MQFLLQNKYLMHITVIRGGLQDRRKRGILFLVYVLKPHQEVLQ